MNWDAIGAVGEIVGAVAVIISLIYLASQIRAQTLESRIQSSHQIIESFREAMTSIQDPQRAELAVKALKGLDTLGEAERLQFNAIANRYFRVWEQAHFQFDEGRLDSETWEGIEAVYADLLGTDSFRAFWETRKHTYRKSFSRYVDGVTVGEYRIR